MPDFMRRSISLTLIRTGKRMYKVMAEPYNQIKHQLSGDWKKRFTKNAMEKEAGAYLRKYEAVEGPAELQMHVHVLLAAHDFQTLDGHHAGGPLERPQIAVARIRRQLCHLKHTQSKGQSHCKV
jgi:hypothetical protein